MELLPVVDLEASVVAVAGAAASKDYKIKNDQWFCDKCEIYCNSDSQFDVHMISQKHKFVLDEESRKQQLKLEQQDTVLDENNNNLEVATASTNGPNEVVRTRPNFSLAEISQNPVALKFNINAVKYLIPNEKKLGKFEKFGFYCQTCDAYMTGQIQLVMHVRGAKHQYYYPSEIPNYTATKLYNPAPKKQYHNHQQQRDQFQHTKPCTHTFHQAPRHQQTQTQAHYYPPQQNQQFTSYPFTFNTNNNQQPNYNQFYQDYQNLQQQQQHIMQFNPSMSTPPLTFNNNNNNNNNPKQNLLNNSNFNNQFHGQQSPIPIQYMLPQNSTPPSSFCQTPRKIIKDEQQDAFATPGGYPYYPQLHA